jgi:predicted ABC-type ATPase
MLPESLEKRAQTIFNDVADHILEEDSRPVLIVMRGLPGSGKSSVSKRVQQLFQEQSTQVVRICTDEILEMCEGGYLWAGHKMGLYHGIALNIARRSFNADVPVVILDNTNIRTKDFEDYIFDARQKGYLVRVFVVGSFDESAIQASMKRNTHNVPEFAIRRMAERFQE